MKGGSTPPQTEAVAQPPVQETVSEVALSAPSPSGTRRWQVEIEPCPIITEGLPISGTIVLTQDTWGVADALAERLNEKGNKCCKNRIRIWCKDINRTEGKFRPHLQARPSKRVPNHGSHCKIKRCKWNNSHGTAITNNKQMGK